MLQRFRENKSAQGTLLALPTMLWMLALLIIPLLLTLVISFGKRSPDGNVIYSFSLDNYIRLFGYSTDCDNSQASCFNPLYLQILWRSISLAFNTTIWVIALAYPLAYFIASLISLPLPIYHSLPSQNKSPAATPTHPPQIFVPLSGAIIPLDH